ncbi:MAG TPA: penicillin-binding protein 2 [Candidatus Methylomirabilis sp.]|nr:penicillin-binding protein 2 [Candidatus Methylomirabilis sp.]
MSRPWLSPTPVIQGRIHRTALLVTVAFLLLLMRFWYLQILEGRYYATLSTHNRLRLRSVEAPRGFILDRSGAVIVENRPSFSVYVIPADVPDVDEAARTIGAMLRQAPEEVAAKIRAGQAHPASPVLVAREVSEPTMVAIEERKMTLPGVSVRVHPTRAYSDGDVAAHLLGYVSEVSQEQLDREEYRDFQPGETVGQTGVERFFDAFVRGINGREEIEVDARGRLVRLLDRLEPQSGFNLVLTLDAKLQHAAERAFAGKRGAVVAMHPQTGEILAWVSRPSHDPNLFAQRLSRGSWEKLSADPAHPLQNRPVQAQYAPGSILKLVVMAAGLETGALTPGTTFTCPGYFTLGTVTFDDWEKGGHGRQDLMQAVAHSCNVYFYQAALKTGIDAIAQVAREFGLGQKTGIAAVGDEATGLVPTPAWKRKVLGESWYPGDTVITGIGQGMILVTPLQVVTMVAAIANGGTLHRPWMVKRVESWGGQVVAAYGPEPVRKVNLKPETLELVRRGMLGVVEDGTGKAARVSGVQVAGKTGTAQVVRKEAGKSGETKDHGWFVAFAPYTNPEIAIVVIAEHAGFGGVVAAPVAQAILEAAFAPPRGQETVAQGPGAQE